MRLKMNYISSILLKNCKYISKNKYVNKDITKTLIYS